MSHFTQPCPTCGRSLRVRFEYEHQRVTCQHCHAEFIAHQRMPVSDWPNALLQRTDELLALVGLQAEPV